MAQPTGTHNGTPCWTPANLAQQDVEIAAKAVQIAEQTAIIDQATATRNTFQNQMNVLQSNKIIGLANQCPP